MITFLLLIVLISEFALSYAIPNRVVTSYLKTHDLTKDKLREYDSLNYIGNALDNLIIIVSGLIAVDIMCIVTTDVTNTTFRDYLLVLLVLNLPVLFLVEFILLKQIKHGLEFADSRLNWLANEQLRNQSIKL